MGKINGEASHQEGVLEGTCDHQTNTSHFVDPLDVLTPHARGNVKKDPSSDFDKAKMQY